MVIFWTLLIVAELLIAAAGAKAVAMIRDQDGHVVQLQGRVDVLTDTVAQKDKQLEAERILLQQARQWIESKKIAANGTQGTAPAKAPSP